jgi:hypothetical protein
MNRPAITAGARLFMAMVLFASWAGNQRTINQSHQTRVGPIVQQVMGKTKKLPAKELKQYLSNDDG